MGWLASFFHAVAAFFTWRSSAVEQRRSEEKDAKAKAQAIMEARRKLHEVVTEGDEDDINARLAAMHKRHSGGKTLFLAVMLALATAGCVKTNVVYVPEGDKALRMKAPDGRAGWWIPDSVFFELLDAAEGNSKINPFSTKSPVIPTADMPSY